MQKTTPFGVVILVGMSGATRKKHNSVMFLAKAGSALARSGSDRSESTEVVRVHKKILLNTGLFWLE